MTGAGTLTSDPMGYLSGLYSKAGLTSGQQELQKQLSYADPTFASLVPKVGEAAKKLSSSVSDYSNQAGDLYNQDQTGFNTAKSNAMSELNKEKENQAGFEGEVSSKSYQPFNSNLTATTNPMDLRQTYQTIQNYNVPSVVNANMNSSDNSFGHHRGFNELVNQLKGKYNF
jgi:hypothetical protein